MKLPCPASKTWLTLLRRFITFALIIAVMVWVSSPSLVEAQPKGNIHSPGTGETSPCKLMVQPDIKVEWSHPESPNALPYGTIVKGTVTFIDGAFIPETNNPALPPQAWPWRNKRSFPVSVRVVRDGTKIDIRFFGDFKKDPCAKGGGFEEVWGGKMGVFDVIERPPNLSGNGNGKPLPIPEFDYDPGIPEPPPAIIPRPPVTLPPNSTPPGSAELHGEVSLAGTRNGGKLLNLITHKERGTIPTLCAATIPVPTPRPGGVVVPDQTIELTTSVVSVFCGEPRIYAALSFQPSNATIANDDYEFFAWPEGRPERISTWPYQGPRDSRSNLMFGGPVRRCFPDLPFKITFRPKPQPTPPRLLHLDFSYLPYQPETSLTGASNQVHCTPILKTKISLVPDAPTPEDYHGEVNLDLARDQYELTQFIRHQARGDIPTLCKAPIVIKPTPPEAEKPLEQEIPLSLTFLSVNATQSSVPAILQIEPKELAIAQEDYAFSILVNGQRQPITSWPYQAPPDLWDMTDAVPGVYRAEPLRSLKLVFSPKVHLVPRAPRKLILLCSYEPRPTQPTTATAQAIRQTEITLFPLGIETFKRGTLQTPGDEVPYKTGEFGYETVMMENADSESSANSTIRDCDDSAQYSLLPLRSLMNLSPYRKGEDDDIVKVVLKWPAGVKLQGASLKLLHDGMQVDANRKTAKDAVNASGPSRLNFYKADGTRITDPTTDLQIPDLAHAPSDRYLSNILTDGEVTFFIEGADNFGNLPINRIARLGGALLKWEFQKGTSKVTENLLVYRGGFLQYVQPAGAPGTLGTFEFRDGKGRIRNRNGGYEKEFAQDDTDLGDVVFSWTAKSGKTLASGASADYRIGNLKGHTPPGWWRVTEGILDPTEQQTHRASQKIANLGQANESWKQAGFCRWLQDDPISRYSTAWEYHKDNAHDKAIGPPTFIEFKFRLAPITPTTAYSRTGLLIHPDGMRDGTLGCIGVQSFLQCEQVLRTLQNYHSLKLKVQTQ